MLDCILQFTSKSRPFKIEKGGKLQLPEAYETDQVQYPSSPHVAGGLGNFNSSNSIDLVFKDRANFVQTHANEVSLLS